MKTFNMRLLFIFTAILCCVGAQAVEKRIALVIGNEAYSGAPLRTPVNDANDMSSALEKLGFVVFQRTNVNKRAMSQAIAEFTDQLTKDTVAVVFYAGVGAQVNGKNYLIPIGPPPVESQIDYMTIAVDELLQALRKSKGGIVLLNASYKHAYGRIASSSIGLARLDPPRGLFVSYATKPSEEASEGKYRNSLYTQELLKNLQTPGLRIEDVMKRVRQDVVSASNSAQTPWDNSSLTEDFYFSGTQVAKSGASPAKSAQAEAMDYLQALKKAGKYSNSDAGISRLETALKNERQAGSTAKSRKDYPNGDWYEGEFLDGKRHGKGIYVWKNGDRYNGDFVADKRTGKGVYLYADGKRRYEGDFVDGKYDGKGIEIHPKGKYVGDFKNGDWGGKGVLELSHGSKYIGDVANGKMEGQGVFKYADGSIYEGSFVANKISGKGKHFDAKTGERKEGTFNDGELIDGTLTENGKKYIVRNGVAQNQIVETATRQTGMTQSTRGDVYRNHYSASASTRYGSIAILNRSGNFSRWITTDERSYEEARQKVSNKCKENSNGLDCQDVLVFERCGAFAIDDNYVRFGEGDNRTDALREARSKCQNPDSCVWNSISYCNDKITNTCNVINPELIGSFTGGCNDDGNASGHGIAKGKNGVTYDGEFNNGARSGKGVLTGADGTRIEGTWEADGATGIMKETSPGGSIFSGRYWNGYKNGFGVLVLNKTDKDMYKAFVGRSKLVNGKQVINGMWEDGELVAWDCTSENDNRCQNLRMEYRRKKQREREEAAQRAAASERSTGTYGANERIYNCKLVCRSDGIRYDKFNLGTVQIKTYFSNLYNEMTNICRKARSGTYPEGSSNVCQ